MLIFLEITRLLTATERLELQRQGEEDTRDA
jgi:hypothetical protein